MIGVDTNILVRVLVPNSPEQTQAAIDFLAQRSADDPAFVGVVVLVELVWVLKRSYGFSAESIFAALDTLFESANIEVEKSDAVQLAIATARKQRADIADCIIAGTAEEAGASKTMTFDTVGAKRVPGMELLA